MKLNKGEVVIFPTDTVYGIGTLIYDNVGYQRIFEIKKRNPFKKFAILVSGIEDAKKIAVVTDEALKLMKAFWPGALTIILKGIKEETIGIRMPNHKTAIEILKENGPMAVTSVNLSGSKPLNDVDEIALQFESMVDYIVKEYNVIYSGVSSTVVDLTDGIRILREGSISLDNILEAIKK